MVRTHQETYEQSSFGAGTAYFSIARYKKTFYLLIWKLRALRDNGTGMPDFGQFISEGVFVYIQIRLDS